MRRIQVLRELREQEETVVLEAGEEQEVMNALPIMQETVEQAEHRHVRMAEREA
jgi:hypothetical protein